MDTVIVVFYLLAILVVGLWAVVVSNPDYIE
jgi:hypothetical protein